MVTRVEEQTGSHPEFGMIRFVKKLCERGLLLVG